MKDNKIFSDMAKSILGESPESVENGEDLSVESILAEFGNRKNDKGQEQKKSPEATEPEISSEAALASAKTTPEIRTAENENDRQVTARQSESSVLIEENTTKQSPALNETSAQAVLKEHSTTKEADFKPQAPPDESAAEEAEDYTGPVPTSEDVSVGLVDDGTPVIDISAFDRVYEIKQRKIKLLKKQMISYEKAKRKADLKLLRQRRVNSIKPATLLTAPIPIPSGAKAKLDEERLQHPKGERFKKNVYKTTEIKKPQESSKEKPLNPYAFMKKLNRLKRSLTARAIIAFILCLPLLYMSSCESLGFMTPELLSFSASPYTYNLISLGLLLAVIIVGYDVYFGGCYDLLTFRASGDSLVFCSAAASLGHCVLSTINSTHLLDASGNAAYAPVCALPAIAILFSLLGMRIRTKTYCRSLRSSYRLTRSKALVILPEKYDGDVIFTAANSENLQGFYKSMKENDTIAFAMRWFAPILIIASLALSFYANLSGDASAPFFWKWSITSAFIPALGFFLGATLPLASAAKRMYKRGVLFGGGKAISRLGNKSFVLLKDSDIFPGDAISINGFKLMNKDEKEFAISMTASLLDAANTSLAKPFLRLASDNFASIRPVTDLNISDSGGMSGYVDGHNVMVGTGSYIQRCGIKIPPDIKLRTAVFCAVDTQLLIIFAVRYQVIPRNDYAMSLLNDNGYFPIIASRDFNITASFIQNRFGISSSELVYPPADLRTKLSDPTLSLDANGILISRGCCGEAIAESLVACHRYKTVTRLSLIFSMLSSIFGLGLGALMAFNGWSAAAAPGNMLLYYILWLLPVLLFNGWLNRF